jgi:Uma2 family endonuclease
MSMAMEDGPRQRRITVEEFRRMADEGLLDSDTVRYELIDGVITEMAPPGNPHMAVVDMLARTLTLAVLDRAIVRNQGALVLSEMTLFQPDLVLLEPNPTGTGNATPQVAIAILRSR